MKLTILSPEKRVATAIEVSSVTIPSSEGQIQILPEHADMIGTLETGQFGYQPTAGESMVGVMSSGFFEVKSGSITIGAETCELAHEIDAARAKLAQKKAEGALRDPELDPKFFRKYELKLQRALIRQQVSGREFTSEN
jgi:F-type H+-transporting ATPase subunit epsilon